MTDVKSTELAAIRELSPHMELADLATYANEEAQAAEQSLRSALGHAINCGRALILIKEKLPRGQWGRWLDDEFAYARAVGMTYVRVAHHADELQDRGIPSLNGARRYLRDVGDAQYKLEIEEAEALRAEGLTIQAVADRMECKYDRVKEMTKADRRVRSAQNAARYKKRRAERTALIRREREKLAKRVSGDTAKAWNLLRTAAQIIEEARLSEKDIAIQEHLRAALERLGPVEDELVKAMAVLEPEARKRLFHKGTAAARPKMGRRMKGAA